MANQLAVEVDETMDTSGTRPCKVERLYPEDLVERYHRMIAHLANRYARSPFCPFADLYNEGVVALYEAYGRWDPARGSLNTLAYTYISRRLRDYVRRFYRFYLSDSPETSSSGRVTLLESEVEKNGKDGDNWFTIDHVPEDLNDHYDEIAEALEKYLPVVQHFLPEKYWRVLRLYYGIGGVSMTDCEIARELGVTRQRVVQLKRLALERVAALIEAIGDED